MIKTSPKILINKRLLWEYDLNKFDYEKNCDIVVQRVIERGAQKDFIAIEKLYGKNRIKNIVKNKVKYLNDKDMNFASHYYNIKKEDMKCYKIKTKREQLLGIKLERVFQG